MKKKFAIIFILLIIANVSTSQDTLLYSAKHDLATAKNDTTRVLAFVKFCHYYGAIKPDSAIIYGYKALMLARNINFPKGEVGALEALAVTQLSLGDYSKGLQLNFQAKRIAEKNSLKYEQAFLKLGRAVLYEKLKNYPKALSLAKEVAVSLDSANDAQLAPFAQMVVGDIYYSMNQFKPALQYARLSYNKTLQTGNDFATPYAFILLGKIHQRLGNMDTALRYFNQVLALEFDDLDAICDCYLSMAGLYQQISKTDSAIVYGRKSFDLARQHGFYTDIINAGVFLSKVYEKDNISQSLYYNKQALSYKDSLNDIAQSAVQQAFIDFDEKEQQQEIEKAKAEFTNRSRTNAFLGITFTLLIIAVLLFRSSRLKQRAKQNVERAYSELKSTQQQLIQSEKMASLGELTAGIAHEIQNPLNFVNNFSEVNRELIEELKSQKEKFKSEELDNLLNDISDNEEKINHHGKRADAIVKGMLQHSRKSDGKKEPTDINALCDEYLRLSYHGMKAKDKAFNADIKTDFDATIGKVNVVRQDIGRVLLNLFNNAFYAVSKPSNSLKGEQYKPLVSVTTRKVNSPSGGRELEIKVSDNGNGIPQNIVDKIFQPFFTTKPTGQGTGLGLSLAYDIIKAHGGEVKVETNEGEGSEFVIQLSL